MGYLLLGIYFNLSIWFKITDKTNYSFWITLVGAIVSLIAVFTLVPILGYLGGALSTLMCYLVMTGLCYYFGQKHFPIPYQTGKGILYLLLAFGLSYAGFYFQLDSFFAEFYRKKQPDFSIYSRDWFL
ncbi:polysaccharide biosynthesis C-terminal domain-containing protein [Algoriphagus boritolerans]|uniref:polysaccharide biosynthesis C-terminal domain-containing protein n=1 Tax=Algoriphagus boritolerans TaxID=308111 RepID=UPI000AED4DA3